MVDPHQYRSLPILQPVARPSRSEDLCPTSSTSRRSPRRKGRAWPGSVAAPPHSWRSTMHLRWQPPSIAVRNEERAFEFWTYVASSAPTQEMRSAAERMAREVLGHVATLRRERRHAFHVLRCSEATVGRSIAFLEERLAGGLDERVSAVKAADMAEVIALEHQARARAVAPGRVFLGWRRGSRANLSTVCLSCSASRRDYDKTGKEDPECR
ncbi:hypothetical protein GGE12_007042 [Rhizobium mongolense]|uniref:Uncharacterized protein n=1 Tax=Rhizobium mongolense TaxID=57676 RepID=A0A7W6WIT8_9HYPH|nr:hypothetical protein [Rhizobium mongolense]